MPQRRISRFSLAMAVVIAIPPTVYASGPYSFSISMWDVGTASSTGSASGQPTYVATGYGSYMGGYGYSNLPDGGGPPLPTYGPPALLGENITNDGILDTTISTGSVDWTEFVNGPILTDPNAFGGITGWGSSDGSGDGIWYGFVGWTQNIGDSSPLATQTDGGYSSYTVTSGVDTAVWVNTSSTTLIGGFSQIDTSVFATNFVCAVYHYTLNITAWNWFGSDPSDYFDTTNWSAGAAPNGIDAVTLFGYQDAARTTPQPATTVTLSSNLTLGTLIFDNPNSYTINGPGTLTLEASTGDAEVIVSQGSHVINAATTLSSNTDFYIASGAELSIAAASTIGVSAAASGGGTLAFGNVNISSSGSLSISGDAVTSGHFNIWAGGVVNVIGNYDGTGASLASSSTLTIGQNVFSGTTLASFNQFGGTVSANYMNVATGASGSSASYNIAAGLLSCSNAITIGCDGGTTGSFSQIGGAVSTATLTMGGVSGVISSYTLANGSLTAGTENIGSTGGNSSTATFTQSGGSNSISGNLSVQANLAPMYGNIGNYTLTGGTLTVDGTLTNRGTFEYDGGTVTANVANYGTFNVRGGGTETVYGNFTNETGATIKTYGTTFAYSGSFTNNGTYSSDPANNYLTTIKNGNSGAIVGGIGDHFFVSGNFLSTSTNVGGWNTTLAALFFIGGNGQHILDVTGSDMGASWAGFGNNFSWGLISLAIGQSLDLVNTNGSSEAGLYLGCLELPGGLAELSDISAADVNIYYDPTVNSWFNGQTYSLTGGGELIPLEGSNQLSQQFALVITAVPEPSTPIMWSSVIIIANMRRRR